MFSVDEMVSYKRLYDSLAMLPPQRTWAIMSEIREAEVASIEAAHVRADCASVRPHLAAAPAVAARDRLDQDAMEWAEDQAWHYLHMAFLGVYARNPIALREIIDQESVAEVRRRVPRSTGAILVSFHVGPFECGLAGLANGGVPMTLLTKYDRPGTARERAGFRHLTVPAEFLPELDLDLVLTGTAKSLLQCDRAVRKGRAVAVFPDGTVPDGRTAEVDLFGRPIPVSQGLALLAERVHAPVIPYRFEMVEPGRYRYTVLDELQPPSCPDDRIRMLQSTFGLLEQVVGDDPARWQLWRSYPLADRTGTSGRAPGSVPIARRP